MEIHNLTAAVLPLLSKDVDAVCSVSSHPNVQPAFPQSPRLCVFRKHPAGPADHQTEPASAHGRPQDLSRIPQESYVIPAVLPAPPAAIILHTGSAEMSFWEPPPPQTQAAASITLPSVTLGEQHFYFC